MTTPKQKIVAKKNVKKVQAVWKSMDSRERARTQPEGRLRKKPGSTGKGKFYRIEIRPKSEFISFRVQDVGKKGGLERVAGHRSSGSWDTAVWLVDKKDAHVTSDKKLVITDPGAKSVLMQIRGPITHIKGDIFKAYPRKNVAEKDKPTLKQRKAQLANIKKAQSARKRQS